MKPSNSDRYVTPSLPGRVSPHQLFAIYKLGYVSRLTSFLFLCLFQGYQPIIIYNMANVGTRSLLHWLHLNGLVSFNTHIMLEGNEPLIFPDNVDEPRRAERHFLLLKKWSRLLTGIPNDTPSLTSAGMAVKLLQKHKRIKIITSIREPISRNISIFFHFFPYYMGTTIEQNQLTLDELTGQFLSKVNHITPLVWFDKELKAFTGIDIYEHSFPKDIGYLTIRQGNIDLLVYSINVDNHVKKKVFVEFLGSGETSPLVHVGAKTNQLYRDFTTNIKLPPWYVKMMCQSQYMNHFYPDEEIARIQAKWLREQ
jgi:hypothetical protein